ncbi:MAG TPA: MFS transporter [Candidatus Dormibacteraeota bacterium]|nr:MFS transporter [Candidatus Dormibacteraeota bacterium]
MRGRRWITSWDPNDDSFWKSEGWRIARRNLVFSIFAEFLGFSVWQLWSAVSVGLGKGGFHLTSLELFWLVGVPSLVGATARFVYGAAVTVFGGRNWTVISASLLLVPTLLLGVVVQHPETPYWALLLVAATAGFGGGNFASSMANISFFYPDRIKGTALGLNAAGGNLGVAVVQFVVPGVIGLGILGLGVKTAGHTTLQWAGFLWVPFIVIAALCAYLFMDNLAVSRSTLRDQVAVVRRPHTWIMTWLYIGTFGSFIGYSAGLPLLIKIEFPDVNPLQFAFLGPLVGSVARPFGGWLSDRVGGAVVTFWNFVVMIAATGVVIYTLSIRTQPGAFAMFLTAFMVLFVATGVGNGSTFRMIPAIFRTERRREARGHAADGLAAVDAAGRRDAAAAIAVISAVAAYGGFIVPLCYGWSINLTGTAAGALACFAGFYVTCLAVTYGFYLRGSQPGTVQAPAALAEARV